LYNTDTHLAHDFSDKDHGGTGGSPQEAQRIGF
jgi:hypothetical protein